jgi:hypothetical protein
MEDPTMNFFRNLSFEDQTAHGSVPMSHVIELYGGPTAEFWQNCIRYCQTKIRQGDVAEVARVLSITLDAHARYHLNLPHDLIAELSGQAFVTIANRLDELAEMYPDVLFWEIERALAKHEAELLAKQREVRVEDSTSIRP